ncbi:hypothetical protein B0H17DRAFT_1340181 [Mycena rosella]|uniref:Uncharacterized protein n=1 Tax=Mycena rosella TaxID=1033263 RepID=A0AAD7FIQ8_MYCRO|nr:hypothetical protein B0H17DRAFT_1340181 [Mycena rosella]
MHLSAPEELIHHGYSLLGEGDVSMPQPQDPNDCCPQGRASGSWRRWKPGGGESVNAGADAAKSELAAVNLIPVIQAFPNTRNAAYLLVHCAQAPGFLSSHPTHPAHCGGESFKFVVICPGHRRRSVAVGRSRVSTAPILSHANPTEGGRSLFHCPGPTPKESRYGEDAFIPPRLPRALMRVRGGGAGNGGMAGTLPPCSDAAGRKKQERDRQQRSRNWSGTISLASPSHTKSSPIPFLACLARHPPSPHATFANLDYIHPAFTPATRRTPEACERDRLPRTFCRCESIRFIRPQQPTRMSVQAAAGRSSPPRTHYVLRTGLIPCAAEDACFAAEERKRQWEADTERPRDEGRKPMRYRSSARCLLPPPESAGWTRYRRGEDRPYFKDGTSLFPPATHPSSFVSAPEARFRGVQELLLRHHPRRDYSIVNFASRVEAAPVPKQAVGWWVFRSPRLSYMDRHGSGV